MLLKKFKKVCTLGVLVSVLVSNFGTSHILAHYIENEQKSVNQSISQDLQPVEENLQFDSMDEYLSYVAYSVRNNEGFVVPQPTGIGEKLDYKDSHYFWKTKAGKCVSNVVSPSKYIRGIIFSFSLKTLKKQGVRGIAKNLVKKGVPYGLAWDIGSCIIKHWSK